MADHDTIQVPKATAGRMEDQLQEQGKTLADLRVAVAEVQKDVQITGERQRDVSESLKSMATSLEKLTVVAERQERLQEDHETMAKTIHDEGGLVEQVGQLDNRLYTVELWVRGVKFIVAPAVAAIAVKEALRLWGS